MSLWEESHAPPERDPPIKEITFDPSTAADIKPLTPVLFAFAHGARPLRCRALPAAVEPCLRAWPSLGIDRQPTVKRCGDVEIADCKCRAGKPLRFRERSLQHIERFRHLLPCGLGDLLFALGLWKLRGMPDVVHDLTVEPVGLP